jgi:ketosteroid isomerase-like protein
MTATTVPDGIQAANAAFAAAVLQGDAARMAAAYTVDGAVLPASSDMITGRPAIQMFWQSALDGLSLKATERETVELEQHGDTAYEVGKYTLKGDGDSVLDQGKYIVIWKQVDGGWKWHRDIFTSSLAR